MKQILVLTDFSNNAWNALFTALKLFENSEARFFILNCFEPSFGNVLGDKSKERLAVIYDSLSRNSEEKLREISSYLQKNHENPQHHFETVSMGEDIITAIRGFLEIKEIDLIVLGARGETAAKEIFMGSNTVKVVKKVRQKPILAVPEDQDFKHLNKILFPTAFGHRITPGETAILNEMMKRWNSELIFFQVTQEAELSEDQWRNKEALEELFKAFNYSFRSAEMEVSISEAIGSMVDAIRADMIAMIFYKHTTLERLTREPVVKKMAFRSKLPLLILPEKKK